MLVGQRLRILARDGALPGVIGKKSRHHQDAGGSRAAVQGARPLDRRRRVRTATTPAELVAVGDLAVLEQPLVELANGRLATRAADNRCGAFVAAEAVRLHAEAGGGARLTGVATVGEETAFTGAYTSGYATAPGRGHRGRRHQRHRLSQHQQASATATSSSARARRCRAARACTRSCSRAWWPPPRRAGIPYQVEPAGGHTGTDLDAVHLTRGGVPGGVVSIPLRHMHSPNELLDPADLEACAALVAAYAGGLTEPPTAA